MESPSVRCAMCGKVFESATNQFVPFCSERCQQLDLGRWLTEQYGLPADDPSEETAEDIDPAPPDPDEISP